MSGRSQTPPMDAPVDTFRRVDEPVLVIAPELPASAVTPEKRGCWASRNALGKLLTEPLRGDRIRRGAIC
jgi:hypothetical protein